MTLIARFLPHQPATKPIEALRAAVGIGAALAVTAMVGTMVAGIPGGAPLLIAPMGASAVLLFAVPASPLAQPSSIIGGNLIAAIVGVTVARFIPQPILAASLAVALATALMAVCRCVHPPSGAVALVAVLGGPHVIAAGYAFVGAPVLLNSILLTASALVWNNLTGRSYPHQAHPVSPPMMSAHRPLILSDYEAVIADYGETLTIDAGDLRMLHEALLDRH